ncbi:MAG: adenosylcobinamide-GDP ribazoletransferase [Candidatus Hydrothermarchaeales archaeon]
MFTSFVLVQISNWLLGGISGDVLGAINEITRAFIMLTLVAI